MLEKIVEKAKKENKKVYIYSHKFPDGDAISSSTAVVEYLQNQGIDAKYVVTDKVRAFARIVGDIPITHYVNKNGIALILDTSTVEYAENKLFKMASPSDTYVIDHHEKTDEIMCIEDELKLPAENIIRNSSASSVCEILENELEQEKISPKIASILMLGLLTDTAKLKFLKEDTLKNLSKLIGLGANYEKISRYCNRKNNLWDEVGMAQIFLKTKTFPIGDTFGMMLSVDNKEINELYRTYGIHNIRSKIFKMLDIERCSFACIISENSPGEFYVAFRSTPTYGNFNVLQLANSHNGGGHYNAAAFSAKSFNTNFLTYLELALQQEALDLYEEQAKNIAPIVLNKHDTELSNILNDTKCLTEGVMVETLSKVDTLIKSGANYDYIFKKFKNYEKFMLQNELLSKIPANVYTKKSPIVSMNLSSQEVENLTNTYNVKEDEIIDAIDIFSNINIQSATISLSNGKSSHIDRNGNITKSVVNKKDFSSEMSR